MLLTKLVVSPECQIACAKLTPGAWLESTSCKIKKATVYEDKHLHKNHIKLKSGHQLVKQTNQPTNKRNVEKNSFDQTKVYNA